MSVKKPTEADSQDMGLSGNPLPGEDGKMPINEQHEAERSSMHKRHEEEQKAMHERHRKDMSEMHKRHEKAHKEPETEKTGSEEIKKIEKDEK